MSENGTFLPVRRRLSIVRAALGMTKAAAAEKLGVDPTILTRWESGSHPIPDVRMAQIKEVFGVDLEDERWERHKFLALPAIKNT